MNRYLRILLFSAALLMAFSAEAQEKDTERQDRITFSESAVVGQIWPRIYLRISDSKTTDGLPGAAVFVVSGRDTLKTVTGEYGTASYEYLKFPKDTVELTASFLGYKQKSIKGVVSKKTDTHIYLFLEEDPQQLNSIIVKGDAIAMVMHGDTTVFNSAAFNKREGDALRNLLKKMPGVEIRGDEIAYNGKKIDRILFNGNNLFGKDMGNAMDMVLAKEVKSVKVYDAKAIDDMAGDGTVAKEHVMDVHTWDPLNHVGELSIDIGAGLFSTSGENGGREYSATGSLSVGDYSTGSRPRLSGSVNADRNTYTSVPRRSARADVNIGKDKAGVSGYNTFLSYNSTKTRNSSGSTTSYLPTDIWTSRLDTTASSSLSKNHTLNSTTSAYFSKGMNMFRSEAVLSYTGTTASGSNISRSWLDDSQSGYNRLTENKSSAFTVGINGHYSRRFKKPRRSLKLDPTITASFQKGDGLRLDTIRTSTSKEWLTSTLSSRSISPSIKLSYAEPAGRKSTISFTSGVTYSYEKKRNMYLDMLDGTTDGNNSKDFTNNNLTGVIELSYQYGQRNNGLHAIASVNAKDVLVLRDEHFGSVKDFTKNYIIPELSLSLGYYKGTQGMSLNYSKNSSVPSVEQLRNSLDDSNPLLLRSGNPDLKMPVTRNAAVTYSITIPERGIAINARLNGTFITDNFSSRTTYFKEDTFLPEYDYTAVAGSGLVSPVNIPMSHSLGALVKYDQYFSRLKSNLSVELGAQNSRSPYYLADKLQDNSITSGNLDILSYTDIGDNASFYLRLYVTGGENRSGGMVVDRYINPSVEVIYTHRIGSIEFLIRDTASRMFTSNSGADFLDNNLSAQVSWLFGKDKRCSLSVYGNNLTDNTRSNKFTIADNYSTRSWESYLGRSAGFSFVYKFARR